jgi:hypothetical protein
VIVLIAFAASIQQSTIPTFATTDATNQPIKWEDDSLIRDIPSNLVVYYQERQKPQANNDIAGVHEQRQRFAVHH